MSTTARHVSPLDELRGFLRQYRSAVWTVVIYSAFVGLLALATPVAVQALVGTAAFGTVLQPVLVLVVLLFAGLALASVLKTLKAWVAEVLQRRAFLDTVARLAHRLPRAELERADVRDGTHLVHRFFDLFTAQKAAASLLLGGIDVVLAASVGLLVLAFYHPVLLAFDIALITCLALNVLVLGRGGIASSIEESSAKYQLAGFLSDVARAGTAFRERGGTRFAEQRIDQLAARWLRTRGAHFRVVLRQLIGVLGTQTLASAALLGLGGWLVIERELTLGQLVAAELIVTSVLGTFGELGKHIETYYDLVTSVHKLEMLLSVPIERDEHEAHDDQLGSGPAELQISELTLRVGTRTLLEGASARLAPGDRVQLVGAQESGKSMLVEALYGLRRPEQGRVALDGVDLRELSKPGLRDRVAVVRAAELLPGTVLENVRTARRDVSPGRVRALLDALDLSDELARLPDGLDTVVGPGGHRLSRSQAFRLTVARAIARGPGLLVLDSDLAFLSSALRERVLGALSAPEAPWTLLLVGDEPALARHVRRTLELRDGELHERSEAA